MKKLLSMLLAGMLALSLVGSALAENTEAPRAYFPYPTELENLPDNFSLPDLFEFFDASADPDGSGRVDSPEEWPARAAELKDMLQYYLYGSRLDPLKEDTQIVAITNNYAYNWAEGINPGPSSPWGWNAAPVLPEGAATFTVMDFSRFGMGIIYGNVAPNEAYVHEGEDFDMPGDLKDWKAGETWADHTDAVSKDMLPAKTVTIRIKDTNPENEPYRSPEAAAEGVTFSFDFRFPAEAPTVDGVVRDDKASRFGTGYPILVGLGGLSEEQVVTLNNNGYVFASVLDSADPDNGQLSGYEKLYPPTDPIVHNDNTIVNPYELDSGDLMHSGWMVSRALDAFENYSKLSPEEKAAISDVILPNVDVYSSAVIGCSHAGKRAIVSGIFDTGDNGKSRIDIITASDAGGGGMTGLRYMTEGQLFSYEAPLVVSRGMPVVHNYGYGLNENVARAVQNTGEDQWFCDRAQILTVRPDLADNMPVDLHALIALHATQEENHYFLTWNGEAQDAWLSIPASVMDATAAKEVYEFLGTDDKFCTIVRDGSHACQDRDLPDLIAVMDHEYYGVKDITRKQHLTLAAADGRSAIDGNGTIMPERTFENIAEMSRNPYYLPSTYLNWSRPTKHVLWTETNSVTEGVPVTFAFHTDADKVELVLTDGETVLSADTVDGIASIAITAEQAKAGQYKATAIGSKDSKSIEICGWTLNDALRTSLSDNSALGHDVGTGICFTTPLLNYNSETDPVELYMDGERLDADIYDYDNKVYLTDGTVVPQSGYLQPYGATLTLYADTKGFGVPMGGRCVYSVRNAKIEALQGYVLALDIELEKYDPASGRMRFKPVYNTANAQTPVWEPELLQNTPKSGLPLGEERWPMLGNWTFDFNEDGTLKPIDEIRPLYSAKAESPYKAEISVAESNVDGVTIAFSAPVSTKDFALAINQVKGVSFQWAEDGQSVRVVYAEPVAEGTEINAFVFRSVDAEGNMIGAPAALTFTAK